MRFQQRLLLLSSAIVLAGSANLLTASRASAAPLHSTSPSMQDAMKCSKIIEAVDAGPNVGLNCYSYCTDASTNSWACE